MVMQYFDQCVMFLTFDFECELCINSILAFFYYYRKRSA